MEIWKDIEGYEGLYQVSTHGRVRSLDYQGKKRIKILKASDNRGYKRVCLTKDGVEKNIFVHRLVAEAFLPNWFDEPEVNHRDENPSNNHVDNLEWCSHKYNINYGTCISRRVEKNKKPILQFTKTGELIKEWSSSMEAYKSGFDFRNISACCRGKRNFHRGYIWRYK